MTRKRNRSKQTGSLSERLLKTAEQYRAKAELLRGKEKEELLEKVREFEAEVLMNEISG